MPVWYERAKQWIADERLAVVALIQEQHPDRCRLFAQWKGIDVPILWDPFNLTGSKVVPNFVAVDEHGIVRAVRPDLETFEADFLDREFTAAEPVPTQSFVDGACACSNQHHFVSPVSTLSGGEVDDASVDDLVRRSREHPEDARAAFRAGVALRMRYESDARRSDDFQRAIDHWTRALALDPNHYVWRRRIQQYGPRMDQPYAFYSWVEEARREILARGETPIPLAAALTGAELAEPREAPDGTPTEPDPGGEIHRDMQGFVSIEVAVAGDTSGDGGAASIHLALRPNARKDVHWNHESGSAVTVWIGGDAPDLLESTPRADVATSDEVVRFHVDRAVPAGEGALRLPAYALFYVCEGETGTCVYLRQDFEVVVERP